MSNKQAARPEQGGYFAVPLPGGGWDMVIEGTAHTRELYDQAIMLLAKRWSVPEDRLFEVANTFGRMRAFSLPRGQIWFRAGQLSVGQGEDNAIGLSAQQLSRYFGWRLPEHQIMDKRDEHWDIDPQLYAKLMDTVRELGS